jgi:uncharacterized metal-binding protein
LARPFVAVFLMTNELPLVYACAGCSFAGRVAYDVAQELTRREAAQMSCLAGVAAELPVFTQPLDEREAWVIDGCPLECAKGVFDKLGRPIALHVRLREYGVPKNKSVRTNVDVTEIAERICREGAEHSQVDRDDN